MGRKSARKNVFSIVFQIPFHENFDYEEALVHCFESSKISDDDREYIRKGVLGVCERLFALDELIRDHTVGWELERIGKVDLAIIRLAVYEIKYAEDIPAGVAINEAVELAKIYGDDDSPAFVNGILGTIFREID